MSQSLFNCGYFKKLNYRNGIWGYSNYFKVNIITTHTFPKDNTFSSRSYTTYKNKKSVLFINTTKLPVSLHNQKSTNSFIKLSIANLSQLPTKKDVLINLRPYQKECIEETLKNLKSGIFRQAVSLPVGTGKTVVMSHLIPLIPPPNPKATKTLILAHRQELLFQAMKKITSICPNLKVDLERGSHNCDIPKTDVIVASIQSLGISTSSRLDRFDPALFKCIIIDEAHHASAATYTRVLKHFGLYKNQKDADLASNNEFKGKFPILLWGCSATLRRHDGIQLSSVFDYITYHKDFFEMVSANWLCDIKVTTVKTKVNISDVGSRLGDFISSQLATSVDIPQRNDLIVHTYRHLACIYNRGNYHVENLASSFRKQGFEPVTITSTTPSDLRTLYLDRFRRQEISILINCAILTEGLDVPNVDCLVMARPTRSQTLYQQMLGRGMRPSPDKEHCLVLDFVDIFRDKTLCSIPTLLGLDDDPNIEDQSLCDMIQNQEPRLDIQQRLPVIPPVIKSIGIKHFDSIEELNLNISPDDAPFEAFSQLTWVYIKQGVYALSLSVGTIRIEQYEDENFIAKFRRRLPAAYIESGALFSRANILPIQPDSLERVVRGVETFVFKNYYQSYAAARRKAKWRNSPITDLQLKIVKRFLPNSDLCPTSVDSILNSTPGNERPGPFSHLSKGEAADIITLAREGGLKNFKLLVKRAHLFNKQKLLKNSKKVAVGPLS